MIVYKITNSPCVNSGKPAFHMGRDHPNQNHQFFCVYVFQLRKWKVAWPLAWNPGMNLMMLRVAAHELSIHIAHTYVGGAGHVSQANAAYLDNGCCRNSKLSTLPLNASARTLGKQECGWILCECLPTSYRFT